MANLIVDKRTLQHLIQAVDQAKKDLLEFNRELQTKHRPSPEGFATKVREVRRLGDFLARAGRSPEERLTLEFNVNERTLLASCLKHLQVHIENELRGQALQGAKRRYVEEIRDQVYFLIRHMQVSGAGLLVQDGRMLVTPAAEQLNDYFQGEVDLTEQEGRAGEKAQGVQIFNGRMFADRVGDGPGGASKATAEPRLEDRSEGRSGAEPAPEREPTAAPGRRDLLNPRMIKDPKLRTLARIDLQDFKQAKKVENLRRMSVHLLGCFEAVLIDHVLSDQETYGVEPDEIAGQDLEALARKAFSGKLDANQGQVLEFLFSARDALDVVRMFTTPRVLTKASVQQLEALVRMMISELGYDQAMQPEGDRKPAELKALWRPTKG